MLNPGDKIVTSQYPPLPVKQFFADLERFLAGEQVRLYLPVAWERLSPFARKVLLEVKKTGPGQVLSYGELGRRLSRPDSARAIGRVMARNPFPLVIPCHRVVGSDGSLTGYAGGLELKKKLLDLEQSA